MRIYRLKTLISLALLAFIALPAHAATLPIVLIGSFGSGNTGKAANFVYRVVDSAGTTRIAATNTGIAENPTGSGTYKVTATWDTTWGAASFDFIDATDGISASGSNNPIILTATDAATLSTINTQTSAGNQQANAATGVWAAGARTITGGTITTYTGNTPQTGDSYPRLGAPAGASLSADIAAIMAKFPNRSNLLAIDGNGRVTPDKYYNIVTVSH